MLLRLIIGIYLIGCICAIIDMALSLNEKTNLGLSFSIFYILYRRESYYDILQSWYFLHKIDE